MSEQQLKAFMEAVKADKALQQKLKAATDDVIVKLAKEAGFVITAEALVSRELSDEELEGVAGGIIFSIGICACFISDLTF